MSKPHNPFEPIEHAIQAAFIAWVRLAERTEPRLKLLFAVPNGGFRNKATARKMRAEGVRAGVPDVMFPVACNGFRGLAIEFKRPDNRKGTTEAQDEYIAGLIGQNWFVTVCTDVEAAIKIVKDYLTEQGK